MAVVGFWSKLFHKHHFVAEDIQIFTRSFMNRYTGSTFAAGEITRVFTHCICGKTREYQLDYSCTLVDLKRRGLWQ